MCPVRAVSIFRTLMGSRLACRKGSVGGTGWRKGLLMLAELLFRELQLSQARSVSLFLRAVTEGDVLMTQFSFILLAFCSSYASITTSKRSSSKTVENKDKLIIRSLVADAQREAIADPELRVTPQALRALLCLLPQLHALLLPARELPEIFTSKATELV